MTTKVSAKICKTLEDVVKEDIENFDVTIHDPNKKGEGFLGEMVFISLENKKSRKVHDLVVKQAFTNKNIRDVHPIRNVFVNEILFYTEIWPTFNEFQQRISPEHQFQKVPKCFATISEENCEQIILENLKYKGFEVYDKKKTVDKLHYELIMKEYGKFHALSFALKALYPEKFAKLTTGLKDVYSEFAQQKLFHKSVEKAHKACLDSLEPGLDDKVIEAYKDYPEICMKHYFESLDCKTPYTVILHGDCWSNNFMFSYDETRKVEDLRFLDFQLSKLGSPCCDLSYAIYSGASNEVLQNLNDYLEVYHNSLSDTLREFGCDPEKLYPLRELKRDWKKYCKLGITMGLLLWRMKLSYEGELRDLQDGLGQNDDDDDYVPDYDKKSFKKITRNLILHLYENDYL